MNGQLPSGLKATFLAHAVVAMLFGLVFLIFPMQYARMTGWVQPSVSMARMVGAALIAFGVSSWLSYLAAAWDQVRIVVVMEIVWTVLGAVACLMAVLSGELPPAAWLNFTMLAAFAVLFVVFYLRGGASVRSPGRAHP